MTLRSFITNILLVTSMLVVNAAPAQNKLFFGQGHYYNVIFRNNNESIVYAKFIIRNTNNKPLTKFSFEIPKVTPSNLTIIQQKLPKLCSKYSTQDSVRKCVSYRQLDYYDYYYGEYSEYTYKNNPATYYQVKYKKKQNIYHLIFPIAVPPYKSTAIIIAYTTKGYVKKHLGLYKFKFETFKVPYRIQNIKIAIDVDSNLFLNSKKRCMTYIADTKKQVSILRALPKSVSNQNLDEIANNIGMQGALIKTARDLAADENLIIKGSYASNWLRLHLTSVLLTIFVILGIVAIAYFLLKFKRDYFVNIITSFLASCLAIGITYLLEILILMKVKIRILLLSNIVSAIIASLAILILYILIVFGPAIIVTVKRKGNWISFLSILLAEFAWLFVFLILYTTIIGSE